MRIGLFTDAYSPYVSGLVTSELMLKAALEKMGHEVYVVTANLEEFKYENDKENNIIRLSGIPTGIYDSRLTGIYSVSAMNQIMKWKLDVIHTQTEFGIGTFGRMVAKQLDIPLIHTYHTMYEDYVYYLTHGHFKKSSQKVVEYLIKFYCDTTADRVIVPSKKIYNAFNNKYDFSDKIDIIGTGMDLDKYDNIDLKLVSEIRDKYNLKDKFVIGSIGRLGKEKSFDKMIIAFKKVLEKIPNAVLLLIGDGPDKEELVNLTNELGLQDKIIFTGKVDMEINQNYYKVMDVFTTFSITETQGLTVLEAIATSKPVIAIKDDSFIDVIKNGYNGYLFNNEDEFLSYVLKVYNSKSLYEKLCKNAKESSKLYSADAFGQKVYNVYLDAIKNHKKQTQILHDIKDALITNIKIDNEEKDE